MTKRWRREEGEDGSIDVESLLVNTRGKSRVEALCQTQGDIMGVRKVFKVRRRRVEGLL